MASASFSISNQINGRTFSAIPPPYSSTLRHSLRISARSATAERSSSAAGFANASQTASFYEILGIRAGATCQEIKSAYRNLARILHPDVASSRGDGGASSSSADEFMRVQAAYATLSDPEKRAVYDSSLFRRPRTAALSSGNGYPGMTPRRRTWETDQCW